MIHCQPGRGTGALECKADYAASVRRIMPPWHWVVTDGLPVVALYIYTYMPHVSGKKHLTPPVV